MTFYIDIKKFLLVILAVMIAGSAVPAYAVKVQIFKTADPEQKVAVRTLRDEAVSEAFAQALLSESIRMIPGSLSPERTEALKVAFGKHYEEYISGYKDMDVKQDKEGISVSIDVNINRKSLRDVLRKMGLFAAEDSTVETMINISNGKYPLNKDQQVKQDAEILSLMNLYALQNATVGSENENIVTFSVQHVSRKRWRGELKSVSGSWSDSGPSMEIVWRNLWEKYYGKQTAGEVMNPKAVLVVSGWFNPEGVLEFGRKLKTWDSAAQEVKLLDVEMKPTVVSASWSLEVSDQWVLRSYLNDYLPPRGLTFSIEGLTGE
ncbi:hypothetical protein [Maridesulfovibrio zosterae]|uniref:hypothetical protein n=1 Tax=Maridesulfovibrio zosterae TaxID=82171 RepID=UPI000405B278|nr:hypothetical protein [Maridesulfovibrio zosterae]